MPIQKYIYPLLNQRRFASDGQHDGEFRSFARLTLHGDAAVHQFHQFFGEREADTRAIALTGGGIVGLIKTVENMGQFFGRDAGAGIPHFELKRGLTVGNDLTGVKDDLISAAGGGEFDGVRQEVVNDVLDFLLVVVHHQFRRFRIKSQPDLFLFGHRIKRFSKVLQVLHDVGLGPVQFQGAALEFREVERQRVFKKIKQVRMLDKMPASERWRQTPVPGIVKKIEQLFP